MYIDVFQHHFIGSLSLFTQILLLLQQLCTPNRTIFIVVQFYIHVLSRTPKIYYPKGLSTSWKNSNQIQSRSKEISSQCNLNNLSQMQWLGVPGQLFLPFFAIIHLCGKVRNFGCALLCKQNIFQPTI